MIPAPAEYLLRCDDLCPTMSTERWRRIESLIEEFQLQPILAVIPDNRDPELEVSPPDPAFWQRMRRLEGAGAIIGLHGYRHLCESRGRSLVGLARTSEFAGVPARTQREWIHEGLRILRGHGLNPKIWVAPRHGFDCETLNALCAEEITLLSDGFARVPFRRRGLTWIPQQLWGPVDKSKGLWTICLHPNTVSNAEIGALRAFLTVHSDQFTSVYRVLFRSQPTTLTLAERVYAEAALWRLRISRAARRTRCLTLLRSSNAL
jgi:predicted deacetylase